MLSIKYICLAILSLLVCVLVHVNYLLLRQLGSGDKTTFTTTSFPKAMTESMMKIASSSTTKKSTTITKSQREEEEDAASQRRLYNLRREVATMKAEIRRLKGVLEKMKHQKEQQGDDDEEEEEKEDDDDDDDDDEGDDASEDDDSISKDDKSSSHFNGRNDESYPRLTCTSDVAQKQASRMNMRFREWWSHSACPDQVWMKDIHQTFQTALVGGEKGGSDKHEPYLILDIGCNKGYTSADFFDALSPGTNINPNTLVEAIRAVAKEMNTKFDKDGGVCNDSKKKLNEDRTTRRRVQIHCFEPSPATYNMLKSVRSKLMMAKDSKHDDDGVEWHIHNVGLHDHDGEMSWHSACANTVGDELCTIVPDGTEGAIKVPVVTVDKFLSKFEEDDGALPLVHMLKIDAEGFDPAVLAGSTSLLTQSNAIMVMFEFNPGLSEKENPHGMWGTGGNPPKKLLEVTTWLDELGYDCYLDTRLVDERERKKGVQDDAPAMYRITGDCLVDEPKVRGWANVVCASRKFGNVASTLRNLATMV